MKKIVFLVALLVLVLVMVLVQQNVLYFSHEALASATITDLLTKTKQRLPREEADMTGLFPFEDSGEIPFTRIDSWQIETVELSNTRPLLAALFDDDPTYRLKVNVRVAFMDGNKANLSWESWRYGVVIGPWLLSQGDGPPGRIHPG